MSVVWKEHSNFNKWGKPEVSTGGTTIVKQSANLVQTEKLEVREKEV